MEEKISNIKSICINETNSPNNLTSGIYNN